MLGNASNEKACFQGLISHEKRWLGGTVSIPHTSFTALHITSYTRTALSVPEHWLPRLRNLLHAVSKPRNSSSSSRRNNRLQNSS
eukprot:8190795-Prorocentrum_lima.AAC.1